MSTVSASSSGLVHLDWRSLHGDVFTDTRALVTGGAGFIGSHLTDALLALGAAVTVIDDLSGGDEGNLTDARRLHGDRVEFVEASILDEDALRRCTAGVRYVFHQAAMVSVPQSIHEPVRCHQVNAEGTLNVLEAARRAGAKRVMFAASSAAYGHSAVLPKLETMPARPGSPYAATKVAGEALMRAYAGSYELDTASLRYFNIFGPRQNANSAYAAVIAAFAKALLANERPTIFGDGEQSRDFTFVADAVHANLLAARCETPIGGEVLNVAGGRRVSVNQLAEQMARQLDRPDLKASHAAQRPGDVKHSQADLTLAQAIINYQPLLPFEDGLAATVDWYRKALATA